MYQEEFQLIEELLNINRKHYELETELSEIPEWDSFNILFLMTEIKERYGKKLALEEVSQLWNVKDLVVLLQQCRTKSKEQVKHVFKE